MIELRVVPQRGKGNPQCPLHLVGIGDDLHRLVQYEHNRADDEIQQTAVCHCANLVKLPDNVGGTAQVDAHFLSGFSYCSGDQIWVVRLLAAARQRHMTRPWISAAVSAVNGQELAAAGAFPQHQCHSGPREAGGIGDAPELVPPKSAANALQGPMSSTTLR